MNNTYASGKRPETSSAVAAYPEEPRQAVGILSAKVLVPDFNAFALKTLVAKLPRPGPAQLGKGPVPVRRHACAGVVGAVDKDSLQGGKIRDHCLN